MGLPLAGLVPDALGEPEVDRVGVVVLVPELLGVLETLLLVDVVGVAVCVLVRLTECVGCALCDTLADADSEDEGLPLTLGLLDVLGVLVVDCVPLSLEDNDAVAVKLVLAVALSVRLELGAPVVLELAVPVPDELGGEVAVDVSDAEIDTVGVALPLELSVALPLREFVVVDVPVRLIVLEELVVEVPVSVALPEALLVGVALPVGLFVDVTLALGVRVGVPEVDALGEPLLDGSGKANAALNCVFVGDVASCSHTSAVTEYEYSALEPEAGSVTTYSTMPALPSLRPVSVFTLTPSAGRLGVAQLAFHVAAAAETASAGMAGSVHLVTPLVSSPAYTSVGEAT